MKADFYKAVKLMLTSKLSQEQVDGFEFLLDRFDADPRWSDVRHQAYALATVWHETAATMQPIREYGRGRGRKYGKPDPITGEVYYGRGYVQLTWDYNYAKAEEAIKQPFYRNPDLVMVPAHAYEIMTWGMFGGHFTGHGFSKYINDQGCDYWSSRRIINGTDKADKIARYAEEFEIALKAKKWTS